jgi:GNAT superfamily N-acetyltransferase
MAEIVIRQATLADREAIFAFIRQAYAHKIDLRIPDRWEWEFVHNPFRAPGAALPIWIALDDEQVVGQSCAMMTPFKIGVWEGPAAWGVDAYVLPDYRGRGIGTALQQANRDGNPVWISVTMAETVQHIKEKLGSVRTHPVEVWSRRVRVMPEHVRGRLDRLGNLPGVPQLVAWTMTARLRLREARQHRYQQPDPLVTIQPVDAFDSRVDVLWERVSPHYAVGVPRRQAYLNWKFVEQSHIRYQRVVACRDNLVVGYAIYRETQPPDEHRGLLLDWLTDPADIGAQHALLAHLLAAMPTVWKIDTATSSAALRRSLQAFGFERRTTLRPLVHCSLPAAICSTAYESPNWLLNRGDHDWDQHPSVSQW